jgi:hypothetical protein
MATVVPSTRTPATADQIRQALREAAPEWSSNEIEFFTQLAMVETANGQSLVQNNVGNLAAGGYANGKEAIWWTGLIWRPSWYEDTTSPLHQRMLDGTAPSAFQAFRTLTEGVRGYVRTLNSARYTPLRAAAQAGDVAGFVAQLAATGYSPDYGSEHVATFQAKLEGRITRSEVIASDSGSMVPVVLGLTAALVALGALVVKLRKKTR